MEFLLVCWTSILFVVDPLGALPAYLAMSPDEPAEQRRRTARRASLFASACLLAFATCGGTIMQMLGISLAAVRIAGGVILMLVALDMIWVRRPTKEGPGELAEGSAKEDVAITPLGVPMLAGPASLATVIALMSQADSWQKVLAVYTGICVTGLAVYSVLRLAEPLHRLMGKTGIQTTSRILGLILASIAVQAILDGLRQAGYGA